jgi:hypothetical protein
VPAKSRGAKDETMKKANSRRSKPDMLPEYDFRGGVRGKYAKRYAKGTNVVLLDPDVAKVFPDSESVNRALRACEQMRRALTAKTPGRRRAG